ncbi:MAG: hypothetical protein JKY09_05155 [Crocinitomicaceae bacterium]|nr:hypothetical protein [Crocinitomicaceae bacterium]
MKIFLALLFLLFGPLTFGQITEGYFQYHIDIQAIDTSLKTRQAVGMLIDSKMEIYFTEHRSRVDFKLGRINTISAVINYETNQGLTTNSGSIGKFAIVSTADEMNTGNSTKQDSNTVVELIDEQKKILGFNCKKAILYANGTETIYWYTNEISVDSKGQPMINDHIPGFPLAFSSISDGMKMHFQASNYSFELTDKETIFSTTPPEGYRILPR